METKEFEFKGFAMNGFIALFIELAIIALSIWGIVAFALGVFSTPFLSVIGFLLASASTKALSPRRAFTGSIPS